MTRHDPVIRVEAIGNERQPLVIVDNFAPDPDQLVEDAAGLRFETLGAFYPGIRAPVRSSYFAALDHVLVPVVRRVFGASERVDFTRALYSLVTTPPEALTLAQRIPHIDGLEDGMVAILHYLSHDDQGGTSFYRHRSTGFETVDALRHSPYLGALRNDFAIKGEPAPGYIAGDTALFEQLVSVRARYNRALIYRSSSLHCAAIPASATLSADIRIGRLTVASFLIAR